MYFTGTTHFQGNHAVRPTKVITALTIIVGTYQLLRPEVISHKLISFDQRWLS